MVGYQNARGVQSDLLYYHIKSNADAHQNAARNYFIYGIWPHEGVTERREEWHELRAVLEKNYPDVETFGDLDKILIAGNVHANLVDWMVRRFKQYETHPDYNEMRAFHNYYYQFLHPEEVIN